MSKIPEWILSIKLEGVSLVFELLTEKDAQIFQEVMEKDNKKDHGFETSERKGSIVTLFFKTKEKAELTYLNLVSSDPEYRHPLETQGKRCSSCD